MTKEHITMSQKEVDRLEVIQATVSKQILQSDAAAQLGLSVRQIKRLVKRYRQDGAAGLISGRRGKRPNNCIADRVREEALSLVRRNYADFTPTFAHEKLSEIHRLAFSVETLRQWMIADSIWKPKQRKKARVHQRRPRRPCLGELVQIDGSPHDWFEGRGERCTLIVFIDDATSRLMALRFVPAETTQAYMETLQGYLERNGRPVALYSDKHSIFRVNHPDHEGNQTQFSRALKTLDIESIHANTPQAKGRVERANQTLQDRLVKEMRLRNMDDMECANAFLPEFIESSVKYCIAAPSSI
jgi:transposase